MIETVIIAILSSGALSALITGLFQIWQTKKSKKDGLESKVDDIAAKQQSILKAQERHELDILRVELKMMIADFPDDESDILRLAEAYFTKGGNWIASILFKKWLDERGLPFPAWYHDND